MILHVDLDAFYASVEQRDHPELRGLPVLVGSRSKRAVVLAASYEARRFGCSSAMPMTTARRLCPKAVVAPPRPAVYAAESRRFRHILGAYTPLVEPISIDEAFLDLAGTERLHGAPAEVAGAIKRRVEDELGLVASVGVAAVKMVAKIASDVGKPNGLVVVLPDQTAAFLAPLPVERLFGVGPRAAAQLRSLGLTTIGDIARYPEGSLTARLGAAGAALQALARGEDARPVEPDRAPVSLGAEDTFERDLVDGPALRRRVLAQADRVAERLRRTGWMAGAVVLKLKRPDFHILTRRVTLEEPSSDGRVLARSALELLARERVGAPGVRLSGVQATSLVRAEAPRQLGLGEAASRRGERLGVLLDAIRDRFGDGAIERAELLDDAAPEGNTGKPRSPERPTGAR